MKCRCGRKARCVAKEPEYYDDRVIGVWRRYECKHCGFTFDTVEHLEDKEGIKMKIKLFTHCDLDGIGCAILTYLAFGRDNVDVEYCDYKDVDGKIREFYLYGTPEKYDAIYITDISIDEEVAAEINSLVTAGQKWRLFDHHATALWLNTYEWCEVIVEDPEYGFKTCGTELFCRHLIETGCFKGIKLEAAKNRDLFVQIVRDYDTWRWKELGEEGVVCKQVNDLFYIYGREEFIDWTLRRLKFYSSYPEFPSFRDEDLLLLEQKQKDIDRYVEKKDKQLMVRTDAFGYTYGVIFAEQYFSELGNRLCEQHPELDYVAMIDICGGKVSYRTVREDLDVGGTVAHSNGGGGHPKAAGSTFDGCGVRDMIVGRIFIPDEERETKNTI